VSGVPVCIGRLLLTCSDFKFSVGDGFELSEIQFTPPKRTRHGQDSFDAAVWISFKVKLRIIECHCQLRYFTLDGWNALTINFCTCTKVGKNHDARFSEKTGVTVMFSTDTIESTIVIKQ